MTAGELVVGAHELATKDQLVLRSLVRLLDGGMDTRLRFSEQLDECHVVFAAGGSPALPSLAAAALVARVGADGGADDPLRLAPPLRMTNVTAALRAAVQRTTRAPGFDRVQGLRALFVAAAEPFKVGERRRHLLPNSLDQLLVLDFPRAAVLTALPLATLLSGRYTLGAARRVNPVEEDLVRSLPAWPLRRLLWDLAEQLAQAEAEAPAFEGRLRLQRWPDAAGLVGPGHPRLAALLTQRALDLGALCQAAGTTASRAGWFAETCLALGIAEPVAGAAPAPAPSSSLPSPPPGLLGRLRERLRLW